MRQEEELERREERRLRMLRRKDKLDIDIVSLLAVSVNCDNNQDDISSYI